MTQKMLGEHSNPDEHGKFDPHDHFKERSKSGEHNNEHNRLNNHISVNEHVGPSYRGPSHYTNTNSGSGGEPIFSEVHPRNSVFNKSSRGNIEHMNGSVETGHGDNSKEQEEWEDREGHDEGEEEEEEREGHGEGEEEEEYRDSHGEGEEEEEDSVCKCVVM